MERRSIDTNDPDFRSVHYAPKRANEVRCSLFPSITSDMDQAPRKYDSGEQVYNKDEIGSGGRPTYRRLWICCTQYNHKTKEWWYRVKDGPLPHGKSIGWLSERALASL